MLDVPLAAKTKSAFTAEVLLRRMISTVVATQNFFLGANTPALSLLLSSNHRKL